MINRYGWLMSPIAGLALMVAGPGQAAAQQHVSVGPMIGLNFANITNGENTNTLTGLLVGGFADFQLGKHFGIEPQVYYSAQGTKADVDVGSLKLDLNYIQVPVLLKGLIPLSSSNDRNRIFVAVGPQVGFKTSCDVKAESGGVQVSIDCGELLSEVGAEDVNSVDFGMLFGAGVEISGFRIGGRYDLGLVDLVSDGDSKNSVFQVYAAYGFRLK